MKGGRGLGSPEPAAALGSQRALGPGGAQPMTMLLDFQSPELCGRKLLLC